MLIEVGLHLDSRHPPGGGGQANQLELAQQLVAGRHRVGALVYHHAHLRLPVMHRREDLWATDHASNNVYAAV